MPACATTYAYIHQIARYVLFESVYGIQFNNTNRLQFALATTNGVTTLTDDSVGCTATTTATAAAATAAVDGDNRQRWSATCAGRASVDGRRHRSAQCPWCSDGEHSRRYSVEGMSFVCFGLYTYIPFLFKCYIQFSFCRHVAQKVEAGSASSGAATNNLLSEIRQGVELRPVQNRESNERNSGGANSGGSGGGVNNMANALRAALLERQRAMGNSSEDGEDESSSDHEWDP